MTVLEQIDFYRIRETVAGFAISEEGRNFILEREPLSEGVEIEKLKKCSSEWLKFISISSSLPFHSWNPVNPLFSVIHANGAALTLEQLLALGNFCNSVMQAGELVSSKNVELGLETLLSESEKLQDLSQARSIIFRIITPEGELRDLPEISAIRKEIASLNQKIKVIMHRYVTDQKLSTVLESTVPVLKNGRQVLAVKSGQQNRINGIVHEVSNSGRTVFIEPEESVYCTNELIQKEYELSEEIKKILLKTTAELQSSIPMFKFNLPIMLFLDSTYAAARYGFENNCVYALPCEKLSDSQGNKECEKSLGYANSLGYAGAENFEPPALVKARHPLLGEKCVPIDIRFMTGKRVLIITGPNTGGKTVSLKTFALLSMMNQAGFPVPAGEGTRLPVFKNVFADIGDEQSLDQSLSTFSGHMKNIAEAVLNADDSSLVLLDELGSGTDPHEGTAIAMAVLDHLIEKKAFVLVTTHMGILKNYGYTNPHCINASVEFNSNTLVPSYRLLMGVPGESHALDIAAKSGILEQIVEKAKSYIASEQTDVSALIKGLTAKHSEVDELKRRLEDEENRYELKMQKIAEREVEIHRREQDLKVGKARELDNFLRDTRRSLENLVREIREGELNREKTTGVKKFISDLEKNVSQVEAEIEREESQLAAEIQNLQKIQEKNKNRQSHKQSKKKLKNSEALKYASVPEPQKKSRSDTVSKQNAQKSFEPGAVVQVGSMGNKGILVNQEKNGKWVVQFGSIKMSVNRNDIKLSEDASYPLSAGVSGGVDVIRDNSLADEKPVFELRLLGMYAEEAIKALEHQLDLCAVHNFRQFSVIHGKGNGVLQQAVRDYLSHCDSVKDFQFAPPEDGGFGKTYVQLY